MRTHVPGSGHLPRGHDSIALIATDAERLHLPLLPWHEQFCGVASGCAPIATDAERLRLPSLPRHEQFCGVASGCAPIATDAERLRLPSLPRHEQFCGVASGCAPIATDAERLLLPWEPLLQQSVASPVVALLAHQVGAICSCEQTIHGIPIDEPRQVSEFLGRNLLKQAF
jgi:hypothetical protein